MAEEPTQPSPAREWTGSSHRQSFTADDQVSLQEIEQRLGQGWRVRSIEWVRDADDQTVLAQAEVPYGLQVAGGDQMGKGLEDDPGEIEDLLVNCGFLKGFGGLRRGDRLGREAQLVSLHGAFRRFQAFVVIGSTIFDLAKTQKEETGKTTNKRNKNKKTKIA